MLLSPSQKIFEWWGLLRSSDTKNIAFAILELKTAKILVEQELSETLTSSVGVAYLFDGCLAVPQFR